MAREDPRRDATIADPGDSELRVVVHVAAASFFADEPFDAGGLQSGPTPYDLLCAALGSCTAMTLKLYAKLKGMPLEHANVEVTHRKEGRTDLFSRVLHLEGTLDERMRARLFEIAERCPVHRTLTAGGKIETRLGS
jgi:putative redox protein